MKADTIIFDDLVGQKAGARSSEYFALQLAETQENMKTLPAKLKAKEKYLKEQLRLAKIEEEEERKAREARALKQAIQVSKRDRNRLNNLQSYYTSPNIWEGSPEELELLVDYLETRIKCHTDFIANAVLEV